MDAVDYEVIGFGAVIVISALGGWLATRRMKRKLEEGLAHKRASCALIEEDRRLQLQVLLERKK